jgi:hypothetical protein
VVLGGQAGAAQQVALQVGQGLMEAVGDLQPIERVVLGGVSAQWKVHPVGSTSLAHPHGSILVPGRGIYAMSDPLDLFEWSSAHHSLAEHGIGLLCLSIGDSGAGTTPNLPLGPPGRLSPGPACMGQRLKEEGKQYLSIHRSTSGRA